VKLIRSIRLPLAGLAAIAVLSGCGGNGNPVAVDPQPQLDTTPPPAPQNLELSLDESLGLPVLVWSESAAPDVVGYQVYVLYPTLPTEGNEYMPADDVVSVDPVFVLPTITESLQASYRVRAVDATGNWSAYSTKLDVVFPCEGPFAIE